MKLASALTLVAALGVAGCGHVEIHEIVLRPSSASPPLRSSTAAAIVPIVFEGKLPSRPFYDVAILQVIGYGTEANVDGVMRAISSRSAELGCDAVVRMHVDRGWSRAHGFGVCVRWSPLKPATLVAPDPSAKPQAAPPASPGDESF